MRCAAGCGTDLHPAAAAGGHSTHPGCEPAGAVTSFRWSCVYCRAVYYALNGVHAGAMIQQHESYACPFTTTDPAEIELRVSRRAALSRLYPEQVPWVRARLDPGGRLRPYVI